jgi:hypothetical protein
VAAATAAISAMAATRAGYVTGCVKYPFGVRPGDFPMVGLGRIRSDKFGNV